MSAVATPIVEHSETPYFAKRKVVRAAIEHFLKNKKSEEVEIHSYYRGDGSLGKFEKTVTKGRLIRLTFNFMKPKNQWKLLEAKYWTKKKIEDIFEKL